LNCNCNAFEDILMKNFTIIVDTREQKPFLFKGIDPQPKIIIKKLDTGDYSLEGYSDQICVERKSVIDLFGSCGSGRERFQREIERMGKFEYAAIVCEGDWQQILRSSQEYTMMLPKSIFASIVAWEQRYNIYFWPCVNRKMAEKTTYRILERYYRDRSLI